MKGTILVVDDDTGIQDFLHDLLRILGYEVIQATNGYEALEKLMECTPALIILDKEMPEMGGVTFAQTLQRRNLSYPVLACSASDNVQAFAEQVSAIGYVEKPFHIAQLLNVLSQWIESQAREGV